MTRPIICITPVKNEAWILELFLSAASRWADHIVLADQQSTDESRTIAGRYPKVEVVDNPTQGYNESNYRRIPMARARELATNAVIVSIDSDEILSPAAEAFVRSLAEGNAASGESFKLPWINIREGLTHYWSTLDFPVIYVDDGSELEGRIIHSDRIPGASKAKQVPDPNACLLHLQYLNMYRYNSKQRWYQAFEALNKPERSFLWIYRGYHHYDQVLDSQLQPLPTNWLPAEDGIRDRIVTLSDIKGDPLWWDLQMLEWFEHWGSGRFSKIDLWDFDWNGLINQCDLPWSGPPVKDPRSWWGKKVFSYLKHTQPIAGRKWVKLTDKCLKLIGW